MDTNKLEDGKGAGFPLSDGLGRSKSRNDYQREYMRSYRSKLKKTNLNEENEGIGFSKLQLKQLREIVFNEFISSIEAIDSILVKYEKIMDADKDKIISLNERLKKHERL
jgi:hypothetical protein